MPKQISKILLLIFLHFFFIYPALAEQNDVTAVSPSINLTLSDCDKCHLKQIGDINEAGLAHNTELTCRDCHTGHRPRSFENIPSCNRCHNDSPHYKLQKCLICHRDPHRPLEIKLPKKAHIECMSCHESQGEELASYPSYHSDLVCTDCHLEHGQLPPCMSCHKGHNKKMQEEVCQNCHQPHKPLDVSYALSTPSSDCAGCHLTAAELLATSTKKHRLISCATCHQQKHKAIPTCRSCHGSPHADEIINKFPTCGACHGVAHDLR